MLLTFGMIHTSFSRPSRMCTASARATMVSLNFRGNVIRPSSKIDKEQPSFSSGAAAAGVTSKMDAGGGNVGACLLPQHSESANTAEFFQIHLDTVAKKTPLDISRRTP